MQTIYGLLRFSGSGFLKPSPRGLQGSPIREAYLKYTVKHQTFADAQNIRHLQRYGISDKKSIMQIAQEGNWEMLEKLFERILEDLPYNHNYLNEDMYKVISKASCNRQVVERLLQLLECHRVKFKISLNKQSLKMFVRLSLLKIAPLGFLRLAYQEHGSKLAQKYVTRIKTLEQLSFYHDYLKAYPLGALPHIATLVDLNSVEGRREFRKYEFGRRYRLGGVVQFSAFVAYLQESTTKEEYESRVKILEKEQCFYLDDLEWNVRSALEKVYQHLCKGNGSAHSS